MSKSKLQRLENRLVDLSHPKGQHEAPGQTERGREAGRPTEIPPSGWKDILLRAWSEVSEANLLLIAGA